MRNFTIALALVLLCAAGAARAQAPVADFYSTSSKMNGALIAPGTVIEAYDTDGIRCGYALANAEGSFLIHVYGNDPMTPAVDEGAREGEMLTWKLNGYDVRAEDTLWIGNLIGMFADSRWENGSAKEISLDLHTTKVNATDWSDVKAIFRR
jgi:hypothetical protein